MGQNSIQLFESKLPRSHVVVFLLNTYSCFRAAHLVAQHFRDVYNQKLFRNYKIKSFKYVSFSNGNIFKQQVKDLLNPNLAYYVTPRPCQASHTLPSSAYGLVPSTTYLGPHILDLIPQSLVKNIKKQILSRTCRRSYCNQQKSLLLVYNQRQVNVYFSLLFKI